MRISDWSSDVCSSDLVIVADLAKKNAVARLAAELEARELTIDLLVNNAGFGARGDFAALDRAVQARMIDLNCRALIRSEERRVGKACVRKWRSRWAPDHTKKRDN